MKQNLLLQKQVAEITIPELNGYKALEVNVAEKNIVTTYNEETGILTITRESELDENGNLSKTVSKSNINNITIKYPLEAYNGRTTEVIVLNVPIVGYNYIYNNQDKEFDELRNSRAEGILTVTYAETHGEVWNLYTSVGNNEIVSGTNTYRYQVSKEQTTNIYNGNTYEEGITTYPVKWEVIVGDYTKINKITLEEYKENQNNKTDKFLNTSGTYSSMYDYIKTTGVYFSNATSILGKEGWIKLYNGETGSLIETFTSDNWGSYTKDKPYNIDLKSIKIETSEPISNTTFAVYQIKEIDDELLSQKLTKEEFEKLSYIYTYVKGEVQAPLGIKYDNGSDNWSLTNLGYAYYEMPYSVAKISITPNEITNQKTESIKFMIDTLSASSMEKKWKNGIFLIELPENIICVNLNDIKISDSKVEITASEILEENGKYTQEQIEVIYYYEAEPIELKIHHYLNGIQNKLVQDDIINVKPEVKFDENGNYEMVCEGSYSLADNEKYNNLIKQYNLVNLSTTVQENVEISDTIKYNTDSELSYYYELKEYTITTKVESHPEFRTDELTNEKVELLVDGGKISGQGEDKYEVVVRGENSSKEIVITPDEDYIIEKVTLNSINDAGEKTTTILYGENRAIDAEVTCIENEDPYETVLKQQKK